MSSENKFVTLKGHFEEIEDYNSTFKRVKIKVFAFDANRNGSDITRNAFSKAQNSIFNIPIIAKYNEEKDDLEGHNAYLTKDKNGNYVIKMDTSPIGVVSSEANISFEDVDEGNGNIKTYIVVDNVFLWKRYEATQKIEEWLSQGIKPKVSMEIGDVKGQLSENMFVIDSFEFEAITALGSDIEPCFPMAQIEEYSKKTFQELYFEMVKELKSTLQNQSAISELVVDNIKTYSIKEGGKELVEEKLALLKEYNLTQEDITFSIENLSLEEIESKIKEQFSLSNNQLLTEINKVLQTVTEVRENYWGELVERRSFYLMDLKDQYAIVATYDWDTYYGVPYTINGDIVTLDFENKIEYIPDWRPKQASDTSLFTNIKEIITSEFEKITSELKTSKAEYQNLQEQYNNITEENNTLKSTNDELSTYKLNKEKETHTETINEVFSRFEEELNENQDYIDYKNAVRENIMDYSAEQVDEKLSAIFGKLQFSKTNKKPKEKVSATVIETNSEEIRPSRYGSLERFVKKD